MFQVELLPAEYGDCILVTYGKGTKRWILIDGGTEPTWEGALKDRLSDVPKLELFVLTHVDADHIGGAIPFLHTDKSTKIGEVWFNGWKHLPSSGLLSAKQGEVFSYLIDKRKLGWNKSFDGETISVEDNELPVTELPGKMKLTLLSPTTKKLSRLARKWKTEIRRHALTHDADLKPGVHRQYRQFLARHPTLSTNVPNLAGSKFSGDSSAPNGSSIAFLAEFGDKAVLFAADAHASVLHRSIKQLLAERNKTRLRLDACKVSHHGSRGNTNNRLLELLDCRKYLISCNGDRHNLPDNETIGRILHNGGAKAELHFNYHCDRTKAWGPLGATWTHPPIYGKHGYLKVPI